MIETKRESTTIQEYLRGCNCSVISFKAGGYMFIMTDSEEQSAIVQQDGTKLSLTNNLIIIRHYDIETDELIEVEVREPIGEYSYNKAFYMMRPTGMFIYK